MADSPRVFASDSTTLFFDPREVPIAELADGERIVARTADSICGLWKTMPTGGAHIEDVVSELGGACPLTGPFAVAGSVGGRDVIRLEIHRVEAVPVTGAAWTGLFRGFGALTSDVYNVQPYIEAGVGEVRYEAGVASLTVGDRTVEIPMHPFLGTVGVAPAWERRMSFSQGPDYLGDVDQPGITAGATLTLPVNVDGALFALGDAHGAQGDGEITGVAIEIEAEVELTVSVQTREEAGYVGLPQLDTDSTIGSIAGLYGVNLGDCARAAYVDLARRLERHHGFALTDAYRLLGQVGRLQIGNMIDPFYSATASIDRRYLA